MNRMLLLKKVTFVFIMFFILAGCPGPAVEPLTKKYIKNLVQNPPQNQIKLQEETYNGCVHIPARDSVQRLMVGFERTGESCSITISRDNTATVSFISDKSIPLVSTKYGRHTDIVVGDLGEDQVLIVQHHQGKVTSVTQTVYDENGHVVYGRSGKGTYIKECHLGMSTSERLAGKRSCEK